MMKTMATKKDARKVRGTATIYNDDSLEFTPYAKGEPAKEVLAEKGKSSFYKTRGRQPKLVANLMVDEKDPNWNEHMYGDLDEFVVKHGGTPIEGKARPKGKVLTKENGLTVTVGDEELSIRLDINLRESLDYKQTMYNLFNETSKCLQRNEDFMRKRLKSLVTGSSN